MKKIIDFDPNVKIDKNTLSSIYGGRQKVETATTFTCSNSTVYDVTKFDEDGGYTTRIRTFKTWINNI